MEVSVRKMTPNDHRDVDDLLAEAFANNPFVLHMFRGADTRGPLKRLNRTMVRHRHGTGMVAEIDGRAAGALLMSDSPHCEPDGLDGLRFLVDALCALKWRGIRANRLLRAIDKNHPEWPHRHLNVLGVSQEFHGKGIGSTLLERFCQEVDAAGQAAYLETDTVNAKRLYERFGFREVNRTESKDVNFLFMWREARKTSLTAANA